MPKRKTEHKPRRRKAYSAADWTGRQAKPRGPFAIFANVKLFYIVGALIMAISFTPFGLRSFRSRSNTADSTPIPTPTAEATANPEGTPAVVRRYTEPPAMGVDPSASYSAVLHTTKGDIRIELDPKAAPQAVNSFIFLAKAGFYDGLAWYRVVSNFVAQSGDPSGRGSGTAGYTLPDENNDADFKAGTFALARRAGTPNSASSQFFITLGDQSRIEGTAIGRVTSGMDVALALAPHDPNEPPASADSVISIDVEGPWNPPPTPTPQVTATPAVTATRTPVPSPTPEATGTPTE